MIATSIERGCIAALAALLLAVSTPLAASPAAALAARHAALAGQLADSPFGRPLVLQSTADDGRVSGVVDAELPQSLAELTQVLGAAGGWCEVLVLMPNIRGCQTGRGGLEVAVARRFDQPLDDTEALHFDFSSARGRDWLQARIGADDGPLGTHDYRIAFDAVALDGRSFIRLQYRYAYGFAARAAASLYFAGSGHDKVGFTRDRDGQPVTGLRGAIERNAMRLYLAIEARLASTEARPATRLAASVRRWLAAIADYPRQLAERRPARYRQVKSDPAVLLGATD